MTLEKYGKEHGDDMEESPGFSVNLMTQFFQPAVLYYRKVS